MHLAAKHNGFVVRLPCVGFNPGVPPATMFGLIGEEPLFEALSGPHIKGLDFGNMKRAPGMVGCNFNSDCCVLLLLLQVLWPADQRPG